MLKYGRLLGRLCERRPQVLRFAVVRGSCADQKLATSTAEAVVCSQQQPLASASSGTAEVVDNFVRLAETCRHDGDLPDLSLVKARLEQELSALSFEQLGKLYFTSYNNFFSFEH